VRKRPWWRVGLCVFICVRTHWMCTRAFVSAHVHGFVHFHRIAFSRACVFDVCVCMCIERVCAARRCVGPLVDRGTTGVLDGDSRGT
jgi:hypothetical protein